MDWYQIDGKLVTSPDSQGVMILGGLTANNGINMELRFDGTEWQDLGNNGVVAQLGISATSLVVPVPESFTTSQCTCDEEVWLTNCWQEPKS